MAQTCSDSMKDRTHITGTLTSIRQHLPTQHLADEVNRGREGAGP